jgi:CheY-like chemotaxis protein
MKHIGRTSFHDSTPLVLSHPWPGAWRAIAAPGYVRSPAETGAQPPETAASLRVLIVEDEVMIALGLESQVEDFGFEVCGVAASGEEAVVLAAQDRPDLILMDINLAGEMDGVEAARQIREELNVRIVFVTAYGGGAMLERVRAAVPDATILTKPVDERDLLDAIENPGRP